MIISQQFFSFEVQNLNKGHTNILMDLEIRLGQLKRNKTITQNSLFYDKVSIKR